MTYGRSASPDPTFPFEFVPQRTQDAELLHELEFVPGLKELLLVRQVHALEHATVWVLGEQAARDDRRRGRLGQLRDNQELGGMSSDRGFYLYGHVNTQQLRRAAQTALTRLTEGEWDLAVHPRCGTNLSVGMLLTAGLAFGISWLAPKGPLEQLFGLGVAATAAAQLTPDLGQLAQRYITTAIPFNLAIEEVSPVEDLWGRPSHFVGVRWIE
ncbi:DUF6391 domain-containing protein [Oxynema aestuarii]|uniref:Uncharacterized protein n=1 Tax=Oxynema aestuarii AP17 TaxID=2064643 RepID=A0A6H1TVV6_9CYAN|nr:DUF6391 domain-containing protein [Oxynema aestuarii]QIZ70734.1 hypothetical protein HCG48_09190 [Oxynema aestuarii AP17]